MPTKRVGSIVCPSVPPSVSRSLARSLCRYNMWQRWLPLWLRGAAVVAAETMAMAMLVVGIGPRSSGRPASMAGGIERASRDRDIKQCQSHR